MPVGQWVFLGFGGNTTGNIQSGFRYTLSSTAGQTIVFANRVWTDAYDITSNAVVWVGGDNLGYLSCGCELQYARVYADYFPNSEDEYINLANMNTGNLRMTM